MTKKISDNTQLLIYAKSETQTQPAKKRQTENTL